MPLRIELAPYERLLIGDTCIRNGERRSRLQIETHAKIIRGKYLILEREADTPCKRLYVLVEYMYLEDAQAAAYEAKFVAMANEIMAAVPSMGTHVAAIYAKIEERSFHKAMAAAREMIAYEAKLLAIAARRPAALDRSAEAA